MRAHLQPLGSYLDGAGGVDGGGDALAQALCTRIEELGGTVRVRAGVDRIRLDGAGNVAGVGLDDGTELEAPLVISSASPAATVAMLPEGAVRPAWGRARVILSRRKTYVGGALRS